MAAGLMEISPLNEAQALVAINWIKSLPEYDALGARLIEHTSNVGDPELDRNTLRISAAGTMANLQAFRAKVEDQAVSRGLTVTVSKGTVGFLQGLKDCLQAHGTGLANRPALKACVVTVFKENRVVPAEDVQTLKAYLKSRGFNSLDELKVWLSQTP